MTTKEDYECWAAGKIIAAEEAATAKANANTISVFEKLGASPEMIAQAKVMLSKKNTELFKQIHIKFVKYKKDGVKLRPLIFLVMIDLVLNSSVLALVPITLFSFEKNMSSTLFSQFLIQRTGKAHLFSSNSNETLSLERIAKANTLVGLLSHILFLFSLELQINAADPKFKNLSPSNNT